MYTMKPSKYLPLMNDDQEVRMDGVPTESEKELIAAMQPPEIESSDISDELMPPPSANQVEEFTDPLEIQASVPKKSISERYLEQMNKTQESDDSDYKDQFGNSNKLQLYGNLLRGFQNMIQNSVATVSPNFKADTGVSDNLVNQGKELLSEFYKKRNNRRAQQDQAASNLKNEMGLESSDLDLENKRQLNIPGTKLSDLYAQLAKANENLSDSDLSDLSAIQAQDLAKEARLANQMKFLQDFRNRSLNSRDRSQDQRDAMLDLLQDKFGYKKDEDQQKQETDIVKEFNRNKVVQKATEQIASADNIISLVNSNNPIGHAAIPTFMARAAGEVGALTEADKAPFGGTKALTGRIQQVISDYTSGKLTPENKKFIMDLTSTLKKSATKNIENVAKRETPKLAKASKIDRSEIQDLLLAPAKVRAPDGSIKMVPRSRIQDALNAGGELVDE